MKGRKPLPTEIKRLQGTLERSRINPNEPVVTIFIPVAPDWMPDEVKQVFNELAVQLADMRVLGKADSKALELLADAYHEWQQARKFVHANGSTYESETATGRIIRAYPQVSIGADAYKRVRSMLIEFGATPSARSRVDALSVEPTVSRLQALINSRANSNSQL